MPEKQVAAQDPVRRIPGDESRPVEDVTALCLSGGGFRAMLFHTGTLWRLSDLGILGGIKRFSSVSGGSIAAGQLAAAWPVTPDAFEDAVVRPLRALAGRTVDVTAVLRGALGRGSIADRAAAAYRRHLFGSKGLHELPEDTLFIFNATNLATGGLFRFSRPYMGDWRIGRIHEPKSIELATAVAASAAFPPPLSPLRLDLPAGGWDLEGAELTGPGDEAYRTQVRLTDGGVYDNLGIETAWKRCRKVLISDASGALWPKARPPHNMLLQMPRVVDAIDTQVRSLRVRQVIESYERGERDGAFWSMRDPLVPERLAPSTLPCDPGRVIELAKYPTRLARTPQIVQDQLINWGYACCDAAIRTHDLQDADPPERFPYPRAAVRPL